jgi:hypothetical protein
MSEWYAPDDWARFRRGEGRPVVALDIDGFLGNYHRHFLWFAELWLGTPMPDPRDINPGLRLSTFMGVPHEVYRDCKLAYRQGGLKRFMPCYPGASRLTEDIRAAGADLWICTTRPYLRLDNIDPDTREWLRRNKIQYDAVIFEGIEEGSKYSELVRQVPLDRIVAVGDDLPEQVEEAHGLGISTLYLMDQPYNRREDLDLIAKRVTSLPDLSEMLVRDIHAWKARK